MLLLFETLDILRSWVGRRNSFIPLDFLLASLMTYSASCTPLAAPFTLEVVEGKSLPNHSALKALKIKVQNAASFIVITITIIFIFGDRKFRVL